MKQIASFNCLSSLAVTPALMILVWQRLVCSNFPPQKNMWLLSNWSWMCLNTNLSTLASLDFSRLCDNTRDKVSHLLLTHTLTDVLKGGMS